MVILFGSDAGATQDSSESLWTGLKQQASDVLTGVESVITSLAGMPSNTYTEPVFVDNGLSNVPGTVFPGSTLAGVSDFKERHITSQEPVLTVYIKKERSAPLPPKMTLNFLIKAKNYSCAHPKFSSRTSVCNWLPMKL